MCDAGCTRETDHDGGCRYDVNGCGFDNGVQPWCTTWIANVTKYISLLLWGES